MNKTCPISSSKWVGDSAEMFTRCFRCGTLTGASMRDQPKSLDGCGNRQVANGDTDSRQPSKLQRASQKRSYSYGLFAGTGLLLLRISDSGVSVAGLPLKMMRFGFSASV